MMEVEELALTQEDTDVALRKQGWYLGELGEEASTEILRNCDRDDVFVVHKSPSTNDYRLSVRFPPVEGIQESLIDNFIIRRNDDEKYEITGQSDVYDSIVDAVNSYTTNRSLVPALTKKLLDTQLSVISVSEPPEYDQANRQLHPDIAPLPKIDSIKAEKPKEVKAGRISPTHNERTANVHSYRPGVPDYMNNPHWWRYRDKCCCHPKNTWHCCWYRETYWDGYDEESTSRNWYNPRGTGFLRCLLLLLMWCSCGLCIGIGCCCYFCFIACFFICCYEDDD